MVQLTIVNDRPDWLVAPESAASPSQLSPRDVKNVRWYLPSWGERLRLMGWWNVLWLPPAAIAVFLIIMLPQGRYLHLQYIGIWGAFWKPMLVLVLFPISMAMKRASGALRHRQDPFCIHCGYSLVGMEEGHPCAECGEGINFALCREYQRDPHWFIQRWKSRHAMPKLDTPFEAGPVPTPQSDGT